jgi:hypothetical protein
MEQKNLVDIMESRNEDNKFSDLLTKTVEKHGLIVFETESAIDARPCSLVVASTLSAGGTFGTLNLPPSKKILYVEGDIPCEDVQAMAESCTLPIDQSKVRYFSFFSINSGKEDAGEVEAFLIDQHGRDKVSEAIELEKADVVIIHTLLTASNYFLSKAGTEKDILSWIRQWRRRGVTVVLFAESSCKGMPILKSMSDVVLSITPAANHFDAPINVECIKFPAYEIDRPQPFCLSLSTEQDGKWSVTQVKDPEQTLKLIIDMAEYNVTQAEIGKVVGLEQYQISRLLKRAEADGLIIRDGSSVKRVRNMH